MSWFTDILSSGVDKIVDSVGNAIDKNLTTDHERLQMQNDLEKIRLQAKLDAAKLEQEAEAKMDAEITARWQADMSSDEPIAKKVRPYGLIYMLGMMTLVAILDSVTSIAFDVKPAYINLIEAVLITMVVAYYGSRGFEKITKYKMEK